MLIIKIHNDSKGTNENASYEYSVNVNLQEIAKGEVSGHNRKDGWAELLKLIYEKELSKKENK